MSEQLVWRTEQRRVAELIPMERNPRVLSEKEKEQLTKSVEKFNLMSIPVANADNMLISGHQRVKVLIALGRGDEVIDVRVPNRALTVDEVKEANIRENRNHAEWDWDILAEDFGTENLLDWGFSEDEFGKGSEPTMVEPSDIEDGGESGASPEASHVRMVQLFLNTDTITPFMEAVEKLQQHYGVGNVTDAVFKAVEEKATAL